MSNEDRVLAWLGLAIAVVVLNDFGWGPFAKYTLLAVIVFGLLTNVEQINTLGRRFVGGLSAK